MAIKLIVNAREKRHENDPTGVVSLDIIMKDDLDQNNLIEEISSIKSLSEVVIIAAKTDIDY